MLNNGGIKLEQIKITLKDCVSGNLLPVYIDVDDNSLSQKWLTALNDIVKKQCHLEKNYCFFGFTESNLDFIYVPKNGKQTYSVPTLTCFANAAAYAPAEFIIVFAL